jgi:hypothetical protein
MCSAVLSSGNVSWIRIVQSKGLPTRAYCHIIDVCFLTFSRLFFMNLPFTSIAKGTVSENVHASKAF